MTVKKLLLRGGGEVPALARFADSVGVRRSGAFNIQLHMHKRMPYTDVTIHQPMKTSHERPKLSNPNRLMAHEPSTVGDRHTTETSDNVDILLWIHQTHPNQTSWP